MSRKQWQVGNLKRGEARIRLAKAATFSHVRILSLRNYANTTSCLRHNLHSNFPLHWFHRYLSRTLIPRFSQTRIADHGDRRWTSWSRSARYRSENCHGEKGRGDDVLTWGLGEFSGSTVHPLPGSPARWMLHREWYIKTRNITWMNECHLHVCVLSRLVNEFVPQRIILRVNRNKDLVFDVFVGSHPSGRVSKDPEPQSVSTP